MTKEKSAVSFDENMSISTLGDLEYAWFNPLSCDAMDILGFHWLEENQCFSRMPIAKEKQLPPAIHGIGFCCAGGQIKFITNSTRIAIDVEFDHPHNMWNMTPVGQNGFDCYMGECGNMSYVMTTRFDPKEASYQVPLFDNVTQEERFITINLPLYNGKVKSLKIGLEPEATLQKPPRRPDKKVVIYGTSITQGGCATRPGMCYTNILSRMLDIEFLNLGFSGSGKGEPEVIETIASIDDMDLCVIDYEANIHEGMFENLPASIEILRKHQPNLPILILSRVAYGQENIRPEVRERAIKRRDFQKELVEKLQKAGDENIAFFDGSTLFGDSDPGEFAIDGCHLSDYGFQKMAEGLKPVIENYFTSK